MQDSIGESTIMHASSSLRHDRHTIVGALASLREILILRRYGSRIG